MLPITYLGAPLYKGRTLVSYFQFLATRVRERIHGWAKHLLSMGGRVELVKSCLNAMSIHSMLTLPVPSTSLDNIISLMAAFIWDSGGESRRHWIGWDKLCLSKSAGGLGIRHPRTLLLALHGKRAWDLVMGKSLWARYAMSRFKEGRAGSPLWNAIAPLIPEVKSLGSWRIGRGDTLCETICHMYGREAPSYIRRSSFRDIQLNEGSFGGLLDAIPASERDGFRIVILNEQPDIFMCTLTKEGKFTTKAYYKYLSTMDNARPDMAWGCRIWNHVVPPKISCFMWKFFHKVVPTDDTITRLGIPLASRCSCCRSPNVETIRHVFYESPTAIHVWTKLGCIFDRTPPRGNGSLCQIWIKGRKGSLIDFLATGMACCVIWLLWKAHNDARFNNRSSRLWNNCLAWASKLTSVITGSYDPSPQSALIFGALRLRSPPNTLRFRWLIWQPPPLGLALDIAILNSGDNFSIAGCIRNSLGSLVYAYKRSHVATRPLQAVQRFLDFIRSNSTHLCNHIHIIRSSHSCFWDIEREAHLPVVDVYSVRAIKRDYPVATLTRSAPSQNMLALALLHTLPLDMINNSRDLPLPARRALYGDKMSSLDMETTSPSIRDDYGLPRQRFHHPRFIDDTSVT